MMGKKSRLLSWRMMIAVALFSVILSPSHLMNGQLYPVRHGTAFKLMTIRARLAIPFAIMC